MSSVGSEAGSEGSNTSRNGGDIVKMGYLKKLKTMKKKFFVLRSDSGNSSACLDYYDSSKKWKNNHPPKRSILLKNCFSINRRTDTKHKYVIGLFSGTDCFGIVFECEEDLQEWLRQLLIHQQGEDVTDGTSPKPYFEHVWRVTIQKKELAGKHNLSGVYLLCLTESTLSLARHATEEEQETKYHEFSLQSIRRCGNLDSFFYMELGQASCLGAGNLWMQTEDSNTAHHMHSVIMNACTSCPKKELAPKSRSRSSSANEASKPIYFGRKWPSSGDDSLSALTYTKSQNHHEHSIVSPNSVGHSVSSVGDGIHHNHHNLASVPFSPYPPIRRASTGTRPVTTGPTLLSSGRTNTSYTGRERCDSLPTRPRMTLETLPSTARTGNAISYLTSASGRPHSMYNRGVFSPTGYSHPTSPMSATYSTDSAGSSLSVDADNENWPEVESIRKIILEENMEDYVQWGGNQNKNFLAENIPQNSNNSNNNNNSNSNASMVKNIKSTYPHSSSNSQSSCSSSPMDAGAYLPMSPEFAAENRNRPILNRSYDSVNHSRESSIHDDLGEGYVPMAPLSVDAGYMSMDLSARKQGGDLSSGLSSCSITSGTPSTDVRFSEFHLDKVSSYLTPSDEDIIFNVRQTRAYSTGSKPDVVHNKFIRSDSADGLRTRAFSVGSRCCNTNMPPTPRRTPASTSTSSIEPCDDLMEIDYSANRLRHRHIRSRVKQHSPIVVHTSAEKLTVSHSASNANAYSVADGYMDMSPKSSPKLETFGDSRVTSDANVSPPRYNKHLIGRSPPSNVPPFPKQTFAKGSPSSVSTMSNVLEKVPETEAQCPKQSAMSDDDGSYMDMKPGVCDMPDSGFKVTAVIATATNLHARKDSFSIMDPSSMRWQTTCPTLPHIKQPLLETDGKNFKPAVDKTTPDGYIDMNFKGRKAENQHTKLMAKIPDKTPDGYVDMTFKGSRKNLVDSNCNSKSLECKTPPCCSGKENQSESRQCSKPITIQQSKNKRSNGSGFFRRRQSDEMQTSKPNFLPLGISISTTFASLGRKKKTCQAKEKRSETVANSGTIFPLSPDRTPSLDYDPNSKCAITASGESVRLTSDFEIRSLERVDENWDRKCDADDSHCDYIVMTPGVAPTLQRKISEPSCLRPSMSGRASKGREPSSVSDGVPKTLQRSTSVPSTMSVMQNWHRTSSFHECNKIGEDLKCGRPELEGGHTNNQRMDVDECSSCNVTLTEDKVPSTSSTPTNVVSNRERVMYATLEIPPSEQAALKEQSTKASEQSTLMYAQIDFDKPSSSSSSPSK